MIQEQIEQIKYSEGAVPREERGAEKENGSIGNY